MSALNLVSIIFMKAYITSCGEMKSVCFRVFVNLKPGPNGAPVEILELGPCFIHLSMLHGDSHGLCRIIFCSMNDQWPRQISFNTYHIQATASYVRDTQMNKTLPLLLRKFISTVFLKKCL